MVDGDRELMLTEPEEVDQYEPDEDEIRIGILESQWEDEARERGRF